MADNQDASPGPIRRHAGDYLRTEFLEKELGLLGPALLGVGMMLGVFGVLWLDAHFAWVVGSTVIVGWLFLHYRRGGRNALRKGYIAERKIGRELEKVITAEGCAIAHNVTGVMDSGDVDHIVATPESVWVIETKYRRVPKKHFGKVLSRLHACRDQVEALLPAGTPVRACLVLAYEDDPVKPTRDRILVCNKHTFCTDFLERLKHERMVSVADDGRVSDVIRDLSSDDPTDPFLKG